MADTTHLPPHEDPAVETENELEAHLQSKRMVVKFTLPSASSSRITGNLRTARAALMRLQAAASENRRISVQYRNSEPGPSEQ